MKQWVLLLGFSFTTQCMMGQVDEVTGVLTISQIKSGWASAAPQSYIADINVMEQLKEILAITSIEVEVILGLWCEDSREHVPAFLVIAEALNIPFTLVGINRNKDCPYEDCSSWTNPYIPMFIVRSQGTELGRIIETPEGSVEEHLLKIVRRKP